MRVSLKICHIFKSSIKHGSEVTISNPLVKDGSEVTISNPLVKDGSEVTFSTIDSLNTKGGINLTTQGW